MTKYGAIYMDPPWAFQTRSKGSQRVTPHRCAEDHYRTMEAWEIAALPIPDLAAKDCALFMWAVDSHFDLAFKLFDIWGFKFKTRAFTWNKGSIGMGYWSRKQTEICLLATRGTPKRLNADVREVIDAPRREHSRKPDEAYGRIERLVAGPYLDLFARQRWPGWDVWGNETDKYQVGSVVDMKV